MAGHARRLFQRKAKELEREGFEIKWTTNGHLRVLDPASGGTAVLCDSPGGWRDTMNNEKHLRHLRQMRAQAL
jgi:hypothetical protein